MRTRAIRINRIYQDLDFKNMILRIRFTECFYKLKLKKVKLKVLPKNHFQGFW